MHTKIQQQILKLFENGFVIQDDLMMFRFILAISEVTIDRRYSNNCLRYNLVLNPALDAE